MDKKIVVLDTKDVKITFFQSGQNTKLKIESEMLQRGLVEIIDPDIEEIKKIVGCIAAGIAQLAEQEFCKFQVEGSIPSVSSNAR